MTKFSEKACGKCGWHHELDAFPPKTQVRTICEGRRETHRAAPVPGGTIGRVIEWSAYCGPIYVRVQFDDMKDDYGLPIRVNYDPCELEHA